MEIKFTVPGPPRGQRDVASTSHTKKLRDKDLLPALKFIRELAAQPLRRPRVCRINGRSITYMPKQTVNYENQIRSIYSKVANFKFERCVPLEVAVFAIFAPPQSVSQKVRALTLGGEILPTKRPDGDNIIKVVLDALNGVAFHDDGQICKIYFDSQCAAPGERSRRADE